MLYHYRPFREDNSLYCYDYGHRQKPDSFGGYTGYHVAIALEISKQVGLTHKEEERQSLLNRTARQRE